MLTMPSVGVQNKFGSISRAVLGGETVTVTQYGQPTMMILPYNLAKEALRLYKAHSAISFIDSLAPANADAPELSLDDINKLVHELRA